MNRLTGSSIVKFCSRLSLLLLVAPLAVSCGNVNETSVGSGAQAGTVPATSAPGPSGENLPPGVTADPESLKAVQQMFPSAVPPGQAPMTEQQAIDRAHDLASLEPGAVDAKTAPTWQKAGTYAELGAQLDGKNNTVIAPTTPVWLITIRSPRSTDGSPGIAPTTFPDSTILFDAANGQAIVDCVGCSNLDPAAPPK